MQISSFETDENWQMSKQFVIEQLQTALASDGQFSSKALTYPVETPEEILEHFSVIPYRKGKRKIEVWNAFANVNRYY